MMVSIDLGCDFHVMIVLLDTVRYRLKMNNHFTAT